MSYDSLAFSANWRVAKLFSGQLGYRARPQPGSPRLAFSVAAMLLPFWTACGERLVSLLPQETTDALCSGETCDAGAGIEPSGPEAPVPPVPVNLDAMRRDAGAPPVVTLTDAGESASPQPPDAAIVTVAQPPSCESELDCGGFSCCESVLIPGGSFEMGRGLQGSSDAWAEGERSELPEHEAVVSPFIMDRFEVVVARWRRFAEVYPSWFADGGLQPGAGAHPVVEGSGWLSTWDEFMPAEVTEFGECSSTWTPAEELYESVPINCVTWYEAMAFCIWDGGRLPTEAEWEFATTGGLEDRRFAWGEEQPDLATRPSALVPVGFQPFPTSRWEVEDLSGNVWEWTRDEFDRLWYRDDGFECVNCINLGEVGNATLRGGSFLTEAESWRAANRFFTPRQERRAEVGVRCVRNVEP